DRLVGHGRDRVRPPAEDLRVGPAAAPQLRHSPIVSHGPGDAIRVEHGRPMSFRSPAILLLLPAAALGQPAPATPDPAQATQQVIDLTNQFRRAEGRSPVTVNATLT